MKKLLLFFFLLISIPCYAQPSGKGFVSVAKEDGTSPCFGWQFKTTDAPTDNGDGTCSIAGGGYTNLTQFVDQNTWKVFYSDGSGDVTELSLGASGTFLQSNGTSSAPTFETPAGTGDVTSVGNCLSGACFTGLSGTSLTFLGSSSGSSILTTSASASGTQTLPAETGTICSTGSVCAGYQAAITVTSPLTLTGGDLRILNAVADGTTKGAAAFTTNDFLNTGLGIIGIDYSNGQKATTSIPGFLTAADWTTFNNKAASTTTITVAGTSNEINSSAGAQDLSANRTWTLSLSDTVDLGGHTSFELPNGTAPTVDTTGEIAIDTTAGQTVTYTGSVLVFSHIESKCALIENLAAADDNMSMGSHPYAVTVTRVWCECEGTCTTLAQLSFEDDAANAMTGGTPVCGLGTAVPSPSVITAGGGLTAYESFQFDVTNTPSPETDEYLVCYSFTKDRQ